MIKELKKQKEAAEKAAKVLFRGQFVLSELFFESFFVGKKFTLTELSSSILFCRNSKFISSELKVYLVGSQNLFCRKFLFNFVGTQNYTKLCFYKTK